MAHLLFHFLIDSFFNLVVAQSISIAQSEQQSDKSVSVDSPNTSSSNLNTGWFNDHSNLIIVSASGTKARFMLVSLKAFKTLSLTSAVFSFWFFLTAGAHGVLIVSLLIFGVLSTFC